MESLLLAIDVLLMILLLLAVRRRENAPAASESGELGLFSYQVEPPADQNGSAPDA